MLTKTFLMLCVLAAFVLLGCNKSEMTSNTANSSAANANKPAVVASSPAKTTAATATDKIGVPECDNFIAKYETCIAGLPEAARGQFKAGLEGWRKSWHTLAANPQTKPSLVQACKTAAEQARTSMKSYKCTF